MIAGKNLRISVEGKTLYHATDCSFDSSVSIAAVATKDIEGEVGLPDVISWSLSTNALVTNAPVGSTTTQGTKSILDFHVGKVEVDVEFTTHVEGDFIITGKAWVESVNAAAPVQGLATFTANFKGNGIYTVGVVPAP